MNVKHHLPSAARNDIPIERFEDVAQYFSKWQGSIGQLTCCRFTGTIRVTKGRMVRTRYATGDQAIMLRGAEPAGQFSVCPVLPESSDCLWQGRRVDAGKCVVRSGNCSVDHQTSRRFGNLCLSID